MVRSAKAEKARQLNASRGLLERRVAQPEAVCRLSREFDLSAVRKWERAGLVPGLSAPFLIELSRVEHYSFGCHAAYSDDCEPPTSLGSLGKSVRSDSNSTLLSSIGSHPVVY
jgi:hypothetical protein